MIAQVTGTVGTIEGGSAIVEVGGIGVRVFTTSKVLERMRAQPSVKLWTHLAVRENALDLYGFLSETDVAFFELLLSIPRIGPRTALAILNVADPNTIAKAVRAGDSSYLTKVSGIGKKNAEKIVLELSGKLDALDTDHARLASESDTLDALTALGYSLRQAREALKTIPPGITDTGAQLKEALRRLSNT
jgi:Holliday junction DNA helicase RuvA